MLNDSPASLEDRSTTQPGLSLPTPSMQNQIHELAKTLPPPRKQNTACDACRARKVKCNRLPGQEKCQHCLSKNYPCTHYVQQATSEKKRGNSSSRRPRNPSSRYAPPYIHAIFAELNMDADVIPAVMHLPFCPKCPASLVPESEFTGASLPVSHAPPQPIHYKYWFNSPITLDTTTQQLLAFLFSPPDSASDGGVYGQPRLRSPYADWGEMAGKLEDDAFRVEFALDLVEVFFQIVHTRLPLLNPAQFRNRLNLPSPLAPSKPSSAQTKPLHPALVATVLAWGTKFSEHALLVADRRRPSRQSHLANALIDRARELAENMKVHRIPSADNVVISLLIEPLQCQNPEDPNGFQGFWLTSGIRNLLNLQINHKTVMSSIQDPEARGTMIFAWWMACLADAFSSAYYRRKPMLDDDDYDIDFYTADPITHDNIDSATPSPREQLEFLGYYRAAHALARISRNMARQLWRPATEIDGLAFQDLCTFVTQLSEWREQYLSVVGVPNNFEEEWDFVSAVSACASDATYHIMWTVLFNALDDFGIKDVNDVVRIGNLASVMPNHLQIESMKRKVAEEALHGSLRIAGMAGVLTSNGYLRLDPAVMHVSCIQSGTFLARLGRPEVSNCIAGLEQYSYSYEEAGDHANEMKRVFKTASAGDFDFNHMASVAPRVTPMNAGNAMVVDTSDVVVNDMLW